MLQAFLYLCLLIHAVAGQAPFGQTFAGDGTYYGKGGEAAGHCSLGFSSAISAPWTNGISQFVALNHPQYSDSGLCGMCLQLSGTGPGAGLTPISKTAQFAIIADECPECKTGDLDLASNGDGRWSINWTPVQCNVGSSTFQYSFQGSNSYYLKVSVTNARVPVKSMQISLGGSFATMTRTLDNYFQLISGVPVKLPATVSLTSILGDTVTDVIPASDYTSSSPITGSSQFPSKAGVQTVSGTQPPATEAASQTTNVVLPATSAIPGLVTAPAGSCAAPIAKYSQCGGQGGACSTAVCVDAKWPGACCSSGYDCNRINSWWWQCERSASSTSVEAATGSTQIRDYGQCGGTSGVSNNVPTGTTLLDGPWANTTCSAGFFCVRYDPHFYQCADFPYISNKNSGPTAGAPSSGSVESVGGPVQTLSQLTCPSSF